MTKHFCCFICIFFCYLSNAIAQPPLEEIRTIIREKSLEQFPEFVLKNLTSDNLDSRLKQYDHFAHYVPPHEQAKSDSPDTGIIFFLHNQQLWARPRLGHIESLDPLPEIGVVTAVDRKAIDTDDSKHIVSVLSSALRGKTVLLTISSDGIAQGSTYAVKMKPTPYPEVSWVRKANNIIIIRVDEFITHTTAIRFASIFDTVVTQKDKVVIDLRGCGGGDLFEAFEIAGMFVPVDAPLVITTDHDHFQKIYRSPVGPKRPSPAIILIDKYSASAAEILAGILHYYKIGRLAGEKSYGKCTSQTVFSLPDHGELWLTTVAVNFPNGSTCTGSGLHPDIFISGVTTKKYDELLPLVR